MALLLDLSRNNIPRWQLIHRSFKFAFRYGIRMCFYLYLNDRFRIEIIVQAKKKRNQKTDCKTDLREAMKRPVLFFSSDQSLSILFSGIDHFLLILASDSFMYYSCQPFVPQTLLMSLYFKDL